MALPEYPHELPSPLKEGYSFNYGDPRQRLSNDVGPPAIVRRTTLVTNSIPFQTILDSLQMGILQRFWRDDTQMGSLEFLIRDFTSDNFGWADEDGFMMTYEDGTPIAIDETVLAKFDQPLSVKPHSNSLYWACSMSVLVLP